MSDDDVEEDELDELPLSSSLALWATIVDGTFCDRDGGEDGSGQNSSFLLSCCTNDDVITSSAYRKTWTRGMVS